MTPTHLNSAAKLSEKGDHFFQEAQKLWHDRNLLEIPARKVGEENRYLVIGTIGARYWSAVITYRGDAIRIISVRRSREEEIRYYESTGF